ncbi:MAG: Ger(x)C family spore germination protein [Bacilli bacterium]|nr:Ger(x)C family spore germination protein [Bacilli bacterium]MDD4388287.1 Ger(x)C family spore germination protein [Bacilli bacterium]
MKKTITLIIISFLFVILFAGCNKKDIDRLNVVSAIGIDKTEKGFSVTFQVINDYALSPTKKIDIAPVAIRKIESASMFEAMAKTSNYFTEEFFLFHFRVLAFGEDVAREGIYSFLNAFLNYRETQHNYNIIVVDGGKAEDLLKIQSSLDLIPGIAIEEKIRNSHQFYGLGLTTNLDQLLSDIIIKGSNFVLGSMKVIGDPEKGTKGDNNKAIDPDAYFIVSNLAVFNKDKLIGWLEEKESLGYQYIMNNIKKSVLTIVLNDESVVTLEIASSKTKIKVLLENNTPKFKINCHVKGSVYEDMSGITKFTDEYINEIIEKASYEVKKMMEDCIKKTQKEYNSDIFRFSEVIHRYYPKYWQNNIDKYDDIYPNIEIEINVKTELIRVR